MGSWADLLSILHYKVPYDYIVKQDSCGVKDKIKFRLIFCALGGEGRKKADPSDSGPLFCLSKNLCLDESA